MSTQMTAERLETLAYELALEYHSPEELAARFSLPVSLLEQMVDEPMFQAKVLDQRRKIDESGDQTRLLARRLVNQLVPSMADLANSPSEEAKDRIAAFKVLKEVAGIADTENGPMDGGFAIQINLQA